MLQYKYKIFDAKEKEVTYMKTRIFLNKKTNEPVLILGGTQALGEDYVELKANTVDAAREKHVPNVEYEGHKVVAKVGSVRHPMTDDHSIKFIILETNKMAQIKYLNITDEPEAVFILNDAEKPVAVYEYCNLHGLWKYEMNFILNE